MINLNEIFSNLRSKFELEQKFKQMTDPHNENIRRQISDDKKKKKYNPSFNGQVFSIIT